VQAKLPTSPRAPHPAPAARIPAFPHPTRDALGLYVHVPFCASTCDFCAFYQEAPKREDLDRYLDGIARELELGGPNCAADTIFWGGGTPSVLIARDIERLGGILLDHLGAPPSEWTIEMAPSSVKPDKLAALRDLGVNRISLGVQSFDETMLAALGRRHSPAQVYAAIDAIRAAGFENLNLDLIFAVPGQTPAAWLKDMAEAVRIAPAHLSTYCLTFEEDTVMWLKMSRGQVRPDAGADANFYAATWEFLEAAGYHQYEISNFARPGRECVHNLDTWAMQEWVGLGPSAASQFRGKRHANPPDLNRWLAGLDAGVPYHVDVVSLTPELLATDALIFGLRLNRGVNLDELIERFPEFDFAGLVPLWRDLAKNGLIEYSGSIIRLTGSGRLLADRVGVAILEAAEV
jgi:oxygen-independent coproporphyrinogen-3 oxidase